jgi:hypothetical protein
MANIALICVREDSRAADDLTAALSRYGFGVCRSASVFEDLRGYAAVVVLLSPGAASSELVIGTAGRAQHWGKLVPVFVNLCHLPQEFAMLAMHDLSHWDRDAEDPVVQAIAYHCHRLAGLPGKPEMNWDAPAPRPALSDGGHGSRRAIGYMHNADFVPPPPHHGLQSPWQDPSHYAPAPQGFAVPGGLLAAIDDAAPEWDGGYVPAPHFTQSGADRRRNQNRATYILHASIEEDAAPLETVPAGARRRNFFFSAVVATFVGAGALLGLAVLEEGRMMAQATVYTPDPNAPELSDPSVAQPQPETPRKSLSQ